VALAAEREYETAKVEKDLLEAVQGELRYRRYAPPSDFNAGPSAEERERAILEHYETRVKMSDRQWSERSESLEMTQDMDLEDFQAEWTYEKPERARKPSAGLLQLLEIERKSGYIGELEFATVVRV
jgi:hypothetical protein